MDNLLIGANYDMAIQESSDCEFNACFEHCIGDTGYGSGHGEDHCLEFCEASDPDDYPCNEDWC